jgi:phage tail sheath protein FI
MPEYLSPGVYVEEVPSAVKPIAGVSTSVACFLGIVPDSIQIPEENPNYDPTGKTPGDEAKSPFVLWQFPYPDEQLQARLDNYKTAKEAYDKNKDVQKTRELLKALRAAQDEKTQAETHHIGRMAEDHVPVLCTSFTDFKMSFGDFSIDGLDKKPSDLFAPAPAGAPAMGGLQNHLAHAVYGFFNNGGTRCYVMRCRTATELQNPACLLPLEAIDEISLVAAPGITDPVVQHNIVDHCTNMSDRFAILDGPQDTDDLTENGVKNVDNTDYGALYFPWIKAFDMGTKLTKAGSNGVIDVAPSGHVAGIYARVDQARGVHKAPANEVVRGAIGLEINATKEEQDGLNPNGVNCIRFFPGRGIRIWGARTLSGSDPAWRYINVRRLFNYVEASIERSTHWVVFEPNDQDLWARVRRDVSAFLRLTWRSGALFGSTPEEAFYVKCDEELNPLEVRDAGQLIIEIGMAPVKPAEFVIFRISQWAGPNAQA